MLRPKSKAKLIAEEVGVSLTTVSQALAGRPNACSAETAALIVAAAERIGYVPNGRGKELRRSGPRSMAIGFCVFDSALRVRLTEQEGFWENSYFERLLRGALARQVDSDYRLVLFPASVVESAQYEAFLDGSIDGLLFAAGHGDERPNIVADRGLPVVALSRSTELSDRASSVIADEKQVVELVMTHLWSLGHRRIAHIAGPLEEDSEDSRYGQGDIALARFHAYREFMAVRGLFDDGLMMPGRNWSGTYAASAVYRLAERNPRPTAIFCANDALAREAMKAAASIGWSVPDRLSIVGVDNVHGASICDPPLTTVDLAVEWLGNEGVRLLLNQLAQPTSQPARLSLEVAKLIVRGSSGPALDAL